MRDRSKVIGRRMKKTLMFGSLVALWSWCGPVSAHLLEFSSASQGEKRPMTIEDEISKRHIARAIVSPDGARLLLQLYQADHVKNAYQAAWFVGPTNGGGSFNYLADAGTLGLYEQTNGIRNGLVEPRPAAWSPDGRWIAFARGEGDGATIWRIEASGGLPEQITRESVDIGDVAWSDDGRHITYRVRQDHRVVAHALRDDALRGFVFSEDLLNIDYPSEFLNPCARDGGRLSTSEICDSKLWTIEPGNGSERVATEDEVRAFNSRETSLHFVMSGKLLGPHEVLSSNGKRLAWLENPDPDKYAGSTPPMTVLASNQPNKEAGERCPYEECTGLVTGLWWNASATEVVFIRKEGHRNSVSALYSWQPGGKLRKLLSADSDLRHCSVAVNRLICVRADWTHPGYIVGIDMMNGRTQTVFDPNPEFSSFTFTKIEKLEWLDENGNEALAHFVYPAGYVKGKRYPLVIVSYQFDGYMETTGDEHAVFPMAQEGFAVLYFSFAFDRNAMQRIADPVKMLAAVWKTSRASAVFWALEQLDQRGLIDKRRVAVSGISNGATFVDQAITSYPFAAASAAYSNTHSTSYYFLGRELRESMRMIDGGGHLPEQMPFFENGSPGSNARKVVTPLLLNVADRELRSAIANYAMLEDANRPVEMIVYPDEYHTKWQPAHRYHLYRRNMQWFQFWLQDKEVEEPVDLAQYERWRKLRELRNQARLEISGGAKE